MGVQKADPTSREVSAEAARAVAERYGAKYIETSAYNGDNVEEVFKLVVQEVWGNKPAPPKEKTSWFRCALL